MRPELALRENTKLDESDLVRRACSRDGAAFRTIMERHNRRLYRIARAVLRDDSEAEDAVQEAYVRAFANLGTFRSDSSLATWLGRIVLNETLGRLRRRRPAAPVEAMEAPHIDAQIIQFPNAITAEDPERTMAQREILKLVERATESLPEIFRTVFVTRVIEGMSVQETADLLDIEPETVKTRLHRARHLLRDQLESEIGPILLDAFPFAGRCCERVTNAVLRRLSLE